MIRKILWFPLLAAACGITSLRADVTLVQHVEGMGPNTDTTLLVKGGRARVDASTVQSMIMDLKSGEMINLMHPLKSYTKVPGMEKPPFTPRNAGLSFAPTDKKDTISGYAADEYIVTIAGMKMTMWLTKAMPDYANILKEMSFAFSQSPVTALIMQGNTLDMSGLPGFPVRTVDESRSAHTLTRTVVSISNKPIADSEFDIPADYKQEKEDGR